jgi:predicted amidophosphoribosyltransferase
LDDQSVFPEWEHLLEAGLEIIFPTVCTFCRKVCPPDDQFPGICRSCLAALPFRHGRQSRLNWSELTNRAIPARSTVYCAAYYRGTVRKALLQMKFADSPEMAASLSALLLQVIRQNGLKLSAVAAVPLHPDRFRERGYNQAGLLAGQIACRMEIPDWSDRLVRIRATERQSSAGDRMMRFMNLSGAFKAAENLQSPDNDPTMQLPILLLDDILTTGATLTAAAEPLWQSGWQVTGMVVASERGSGS